MLSVRRISLYPFKLIFLLMFVLTSNVQAEMNASAMGADTCLGCHGIPSYTNVYPTYHVPRIAGQHKAYLISALKEYRSGNRHHPTMNAQAKSMNDQHIEKVATYFSALESDKGTATPNTPKAIEAKAATCIACHTADGNSVIPNFPKIAGQQRDYLYHSLKGYKDGSRKNPIMSGIVLTLTDEDMKALAKYYSKQSGLRDIPMNIEEQ